MNAGFGRIAVGIAGILGLASSAEAQQKAPTPAFQVVPPLENVVSLSLTVQGPGRVSPSVPAKDPRHPTYPPGTSVWLYSVPDANGQFDRWEGACAGQGPTCVITLKTSVAVTCVFQPKSATVKHRVTVKVEGDVSSAAVTSHPAGIDCGKGSGSCTAEFLSMSQVRLTPHADGMYRVDWREGPTSGVAAEDVLTIDVDHTVTAKFTKIVRRLPEFVHVSSPLVMTGIAKLEDSLK